MTEPTEAHTRAECALRSLGDAIATRTVPPPAGALRAHAERRRRARRTTTAVLAAAAVAGVLLGGSQVLPLTAGPTIPPMLSTTPPASVPPASPPGPPVEPGGGADGTFADVDWWHATITLPPHDQCPSGELTVEPFQLSAISTSRPAAQGQGRIIQYFVGAEEDWAGGDVLGAIAHGDLTGDGRAEVVLWVGCAPADGLDGAGEGMAHLLAVTRTEQGDLVGLGYPAPPGAAYRRWWVEGGALLVHLGPYWTGPADRLPVPGATRGYRWDGQQFVEFEPAPPLVPLAAGQSAPPVVPGPVADGLGCPGNSLRFARDGVAYAGTATAAGATYAAPERTDQQFLFDLTADGGDPLVVTALACTDPAGQTRHGLAVFEPLGSIGWQGVAVLRHPQGRPAAAWRLVSPGMLRVTWSGADGEETDHQWTGTGLVPSGE